MVSGAAGLRATVVIAIFAVLVMSSLGHPRNKPLCSDCSSLCNTNCAAMVMANCSNECNYQFSCQQCQSQVRQACCKNFCSSSDGTSSYSCCPNNCVDGDCSTCNCDNCNAAIQNSCISACSDRYCRACQFGISQQCMSSCLTDCNDHCVKKDCWRCLVLLCNYMYFSSIVVSPRCNVLEINKFPLS